MPRDPKWERVALAARAKAGVVLAIVGRLLDLANQAERRGSIMGYSLADLSVELGYEEREIGAIIEQLVAHRTLSEDAFVNWEKYQFKDPAGAARKRRQRAAGELPDASPPRASLAPRNGAPEAAKPAPRPLSRTVSSRPEVSRTFHLCPGASPHTHTDTDTDSVRRSVPRPRASAREGPPTDGLTNEFLKLKLTQAIGIAAGPGLLTMSVVSEFRDWCETNRCDLERDVLPVVRDVAKGVAKGQRKKWGKFPGPLTGELERMLCCRDNRLECERRRLEHVEAVARLGAAPTTAREAGSVVRLKPLSLSPEERDEREREVREASERRKLNAAKVRDEIAKAAEAIRMLEAKDAELRREKWQRVARQK